MKVFSDLAVSLSSVRLVAVVDQAHTTFGAIKIGGLGGIKESPKADAPKKGLLVLHNAPPLEISAESARELIDAIKACGSG